LEDSYWTASVEQSNSDYISSLPPAIILDIDETVLDNSPFQARMIKQGKSYNSADWNAWCNEANAEAIPGAVTFTREAAKKGVAIFYISNRDHSVEDATRQNLIELGFPVSDSLDTILTNGEKPDWNSSKINRRATVEQNYRVIMLFGDDLNDFIPAKNITQQERDTIIEDYSEYFGRKWFMLPNPVYGSWDQALYNFNRHLTQEERLEIQRKQLDSKN
jgi:acid phosphatase